MEPLTFAAIAVIGAKLLEPAYQKTIEIATESFWKKVPQFKPVVEAGATLRNLLGQDQSTAKALEEVAAPQVKQEENSIYLMKQDVENLSSIIGNQDSEDVQNAVQFLSQMSQLLPKQVIESNIKLVSKEEYQATFREIGIRNLRSKNIRIKDFSMSSKIENSGQDVERIGIDGANIEQLDIENFTLGDSNEKKK